MKRKDEIEMMKYYENRFDNQIDNYNMLMLEIEERINNTDDLFNPLDLDDVKEKYKFIQKDLKTNKGITTNQDDKDWQMY